MVNLSTYALVNVLEYFPPSTQIRYIRRFSRQFDHAVKETLSRRLYQLRREQTLLRQELRTIE